MIDLEQFKHALEPHKVAQIEPSDYLTHDTLKFLSSYNPHDVASKLFPKQQPITGIINGNVGYAAECPKWMWEAECPQCGAKYDNTTSKSKLFNYLAFLRRFPTANPRSKAGYKYEHTRKDYECPKCCADRKNKEIQVREEWNLKAQARDAEKLEVFLSTYLNPGSVFTRGVNWSAWEATVDAFPSSESEAVASYIKEMKYADFLQTPYWKAVAYRVRKLYKFCCTLCSRANSLNVHHRTYTRHGYELQFWREDLICLCSDCHETFHSEREVA